AARPRCEAGLRVADDLGAIQTRLCFAAAAVRTGGPQDRRMDLASTKGRSLGIVRAVRFDLPYAGNISRRAACQPVDRTIVVVRAMHAMVFKVTKRRFSWTS